MTLSLVSGAPIKVPDRARQLVVKGVRLARQTRDGRVIVSWNQAGQTAVLSGVGGWAGIGLAAGLTDPTAGLGAVGGYAALSNYTALGGALTVFALPQ